MTPADRKSIIALVLIVLAAAPLVLLMHDAKLGGEVSPLSPVKPPPGYVPPRPAAPPMLGANGTQVLAPNAPPAAPPAPQKLQLAAEPSRPSLILDVYDPAKLRAAATRNAWLQQTLKQPLGQGFIGPWAGFWGTQGEDLAASFKGEVQDFLADQLLAAPLRVVWFGGADTTSTPVLLVPQPQAGADAAFEAMSKVAQHGVQLAERCPGDPEDDPDGGAAPPKRHIEVQRWVLANQALYAARGDGQVALARNPTAVVQGLCQKLPAPARTPGADVELTLASDGFGHEAQVLTALLGLDPAPRLAFAVEGDKLVPRGIAGALAHPGRVDVAPLSVDLLRSVPVDAPVLFTAQLKLPATLDPEALTAYFSGKSTAPTATRQVALVWTPRGDAKAPAELAVFWSQPSDAAALQAAFAGKNAMVHDTVCNQLVFASSKELLGRIQKTCQGHQPALLNAAGPVVAGLKAPASVGLAVQLGAALSGLTLDAAHAETPGKVPPEIEGAQQRLEQLPTFGFTGTAQGPALVAGGFHS